jgi:hypothetical protein
VIAALSRETHPLCGEAGVAPLGPLV